MRFSSWLASCFGLSLLGLPGAAAAAQQEPGAPALDESEEEFMELLEFLGEFTTEDGRWVDPMELEGDLEAAEETDAGGDDTQEEEQAEPLAGVAHHVGARHAVPVYGADTSSSRGSATELKI